MVLIWTELTDESDGLGYSVQQLKKCGRRTFFRVMKCSRVIGRASSGGKWNLGLYKYWMRI